MVSDLVGGSGCDDTAADQDRDAVGEREHRVHVVLDQEDRVLPFQARQQLRHRARPLDAQTRHRLVEQQHDRVGCERHAEFELPVLPVRHLRRDEVAEGGKADIRDELARRPAQARNPFRRLPESEAVALSGLNGERNVSLGGEAVEDARDLERSRQPEPRAAGGRQLADVAPVEHDPSRIRLEVAGQLSDQRGLAGAVRTDERMGFALADGERHVVGGDERAERLAQVLDLEQELAHLAAPGLESAARSSASGKSTLDSPSLSSAPVARTSMPQMPSFTSSTRATSSGPKNSIQCSVKSDSTSRKARKNAAPTIGPISELADPRMTIASNSPDSCQLIVAGLTNFAWLAMSAPASPAMPPAMTKMTSLYG